MEIPVSYIIKYGQPFGIIVYDTSTDKYLDRPMSNIQRELPCQDYMSCSLSTNNIATVVGKVYSDNSYVVCFGDNFLYNLDRQTLLKYRLSNMKLTKGNKLICIDGKLPDMQDMFPDRGIKFIGHITEVQASSQGEARKFNALYNGKLCVVKFTKGNNVDLHNEIVYKQLADCMNVPCCRVMLSEYYHKRCCISIYEYNPQKDLYISFKNLQKPIDSIVSNFDWKSRRSLDKILLLDYLTSQQDRHLSNLATCNGRMYPAFDNGECFGLGAIGLSSQSFRQYILRQDKHYLELLLNGNVQGACKLLSVNYKNIFVNNYMSLGLSV
jgi:hypothetical protein